jgi:predicted amidohydrolase
VAIDINEAALWHERIVDLARRYGLHLVIGYAEQSGEHIFSAAVLAGPDGVLAHYCKTHVVGDDAAWCSPGMEKPPVVDLPLGRVGLLIGTDLCFPETARSLAVEGCDLLLVPAGVGLPPSFGIGPTAVPLGTPWSTANPHHFHLARQRAIENNCYLAFASLPRPHGIGSSAVFGPSPPYRVGEQILDPCENGVVVRMIDTSHIDTPYPRLAPVRTKELVRMRQTHLYDALQIVPAETQNKQR